MNFSDISQRKALISNCKVAENEGKEPPRVSKPMSLKKIKKVPLAVRNEG